MQAFFIRLAQKMVPNHCNTREETIDARGVYARIMLHLSMRPPMPETPFWSHLAASSVGNDRDIRARLCWLGAKHHVKQLLAQDRIRELMQLIKEGADNE